MPPSILKYCLRVLQCSHVHNLTWCVLLQPVSGRSGSNLRGFIPHAISFTLRGQVRLPLLRPAGRHGGGPVRPCTLSMEKNIHSWLPQGCFWWHPILMIHWAYWVHSKNALLNKNILYVIILVKVPLVRPLPSEPLF